MNTLFRTHFNSATVETYILHVPIHIETHMSKYSERVDKMWHSLISHGTWTTLPLLHVLRCERYGRLLLKHVEKDISEDFFANHFPILVWQLSYPNFEKWLFLPSIPATVLQLVFACKSRPTSPFSTFQVMYRLAPMHLSFSLCRCQSVYLSPTKNENHAIWFCSWCVPCVSCECVWVLALASTRNIVTPPCSNTTVTRK